MLQGTSYSTFHWFSEYICPSKLNSTRVWCLGCRTKTSKLPAAEVKLGPVLFSLSKLYTASFSWEAGSVQLYGCELLPRQLDELLHLI